jgi:hypothetical protein
VIDTDSLANMFPAKPTRSGLGIVAGLDRLAPDRANGMVMADVDLSSHHAGRLPSLQPGSSLLTVSPPMQDQDL